MKFFSLLFLFLPGQVIGQNNVKYDIWKNAYAKCESITGGTYLGTQKTKNLTSKDTIYRKVDCAFVREPEDSLFGSYFDVTATSREGGVEQNTYNGDYFVSCIDQKGMISQGKDALRDLKKRAHNYLLYYPFNNIKNSELAFIDSTDLIFVEEAKINHWDCYHFQVVEGVDTASMVKILGARFDFWINKTDLMPIQYAVYYQVDLMGVVSDQYEEFTLDSYRLNHLNRHEFRTLEWYAENACSMQSYEAHSKKQESLKVGDIVPKWDLTTNQKQTIHSSNHGYKLVLFDFFYQSCFPCLKAIPMLNRLNEKYGDKGLLIVGIDNVDPKDERFYEFVNERKMAYPIAVSENYLDKDFQVSSYPAMFLMDNAGKLLYLSSGFGTGSEKEVDELLDSLLKGQ